MVQGITLESIYDETGGDKPHPLRVTKDGDYKGGAVHESGYTQSSLHIHRPNHQAPPPQPYHPLLAATTDPVILLPVANTSPVEHPPEKISM